MGNAYAIVVRKHQGERPLEKLRNRWKGIIINLTEIKWEDVNWVYMAHDRIYSRFCEQYNEPSGSIMVELLSNYQLLKMAPAL
jgi:hypothetical protein